MAKGFAAIGTVLKVLKQTKEHTNVGERTIQPNTLGIITGYQSDKKCRIMFCPDWTICAWSMEEIEQKTLVLPSDHPDVPNVMQQMLAQRVQNILSQAKQSKSKTVLIKADIIHDLIGLSSMTANGKDIREILFFKGEKTLQGLELHLNDVQSIAQAITYNQKTENNKIIDKKNYPIKVEQTDEVCESKYKF